MEHGVEQWSKGGFVTHFSASDDAIFLSSLSVGESVVLETVAVAGDMGNPAISECLREDGDSAGALGCTFIIWE